MLFNKIATYVLPIGDIVHSTKMTDTLYQVTLDCLRDSFEPMQLSSPDAAKIYRGDGFQVQFSNPRDALKQTLLLKLALHSCAVSPKPILTTLSLAFGDYTKLDENRIHLQDLFLSALVGA